MNERVEGLSQKTLSRGPLPHTFTETQITRQEKLFDAPSGEKITKCEMARLLVVMTRSLGASIPGDGGPGGPSRGPQGIGYPPRANWEAGFRSYMSAAGDSAEERGGRLI